MNPRHWLAVLCFAMLGLCCWPLLAEAALIDFEIAPTGSFPTYTEAGVIFSATTDLYGAVPDDRPHFLGLGLGGSAGIAPTGSQGMLPVPIRATFPWIVWDGGGIPANPDAPDRVRELHPTVRGSISGGASAVSVVVGNYPTGRGSDSCISPEGVIGDFEYFLRAYDDTGRTIGSDSLARSCADVFLEITSPFVLSLAIDPSDIAATTGGVGSQTISYVLIGVDAGLTCPGFPFEVCSGSDTIRFPFLGLWVDNFNYTTPVVTVSEPDEFALLFAAVAGLYFSRAGRRHWRSTPRTRDSAEAK